MFGAFALFGLIGSGAYVLRQFSKDKAVIAKANYAYRGTEPVSKRQLELEHSMGNYYMCHDGEQLMMKWARLCAEEGARTPGEKGAIRNRIKAEEVRWALQHENEKVNEVQLGNLGYPHVADKSKSMMHQVYNKK